MMGPLQMMGEREMKTFHIDGAGPRPDGTGSGFAWVRLDRDEQRVKWVDGMTSNQAEYRGLLSVLKYLSSGSIARIYTDSQLVCEQFNHRWAVHDLDLRALLQKARDLIEYKELSVQVRWIPREENLAGKLLGRTPSRWRRNKTA
jgi:ribonuclease HI